MIDILTDSKMYGQRKLIRQLEKFAENVRHDPRMTERERTLLLMDIKRTIADIWSTAYPDLPPPYSF